MAKSNSQKTYAFYTWYTVLDLPKKVLVTGLETFSLIT